MKKNDHALNIAYSLVKSPCQTSIPIFVYIYIPSLVFPFLDVFTLPKYEYSVQFPFFGLWTGSEFNEK